MVNDSLISFLLNCFRSVYNFGANLILINMNNGTIQVSLNDLLIALTIVLVVLKALLNVVKLPSNGVDVK